MNASPNTASPARPRNHMWLMLVLGLVAGVIATAIGVVLIGMPLALGHRNDLPLETLYGNAAVDLAVKMRAGNQPNPLGQNNRALETGRNAYTGSCAECHGANGDGKGAFGQSLYPPATDLRSRDTQEKSDAQLFWIVKNGLSFAGMPGFASQYDDQTSWAMVSYVRSFGKQAAVPLAVSPPTTEQLAKADPSGDAIARGAAYYFAQGCHECHGAVGNAPGELRLRGGGREASQAVRRGRQGMPAYTIDQLSDAQLNDLIQYMNTFFARGG